MISWSAVYPALGHDLPDDFDPEAHRFVPSLFAEDDVIDELLPLWREEARVAGAALAPFTRDARTKHWLDLGGMVWKHRALLEVQVQGLTLSIAADQVADYVNYLARFSDPGRTLPSGAHVYGVSTMVIPLLVRPSFLDELRPALLALYPEAEAIATAEDQAQAEQRAKLGAHPNVMLVPKKSRPCPEEA